MLGPTYFSVLRRSGAGVLRTALTHPTTAYPTGPAAILPAARRSLHQVPELHHMEKYKDEGIAPLFTAKGFDVAWNQYQGMLVDGLNELVADTALGNETAFDIAIQTSRRPELAATFNFASQAHNNHFFFESLITSSSQPPQDSFIGALAPVFPNFSVLKAELTVTALSLFGSGTVWLVLENTRKLRILATYNAGSPYPGAHARRQDIDTNTLSSPSQAGARYDRNGDEILNLTRAVAKSAGGISWPVPLLSVSVWPQVYMTDYGVSMEGKRQYLENWWRCIDWSVVSRRHMEHFPTRVHRTLQR